MPHNIDTDVALLRQELGQSNNMLEKLDKAIDKISEVNYTISKIIAIHEDRMERLEKVNNDNSLLFEKRSDQVKEEMEEMQEEIGKRIDASENRVMSALEAMKKELKEDYKTHKEEVEKDLKRVEQKSEELDKKISRLEKWRYYIAGGVAVIGILLAKLDVIGKVFTLFIK